MKFLRRIQKRLAEFCASISQFPVETALCLFTFVLSVALCEMNQRNWMEDSYFFKRCFFYKDEEAETCSTTEDKRRLLVVGVVGTYPAVLFPNVRFW